MSTDADMSLEAMGQLSRRRSNRVGTAINPFQGCTFHQCRQCLRIQAHRHSNTRSLPHRRTPRARRRQVLQVIPTFGLISPRLDPFITDRDSVKKTLAHTNSVDDSLERHRCTSRHGQRREHNAHRTCKGRARVFVRGPVLSQPESVRLPTPTSAAGPRRRTRSVCRRSSARPSPWPPSASGSTNGHRP